jgi:phytoene dehydrogenase-like protein
MPWVFEELFEAAGESLARHVELIQVSPLADYVFADGTRFTYTTSLPEWLATVRQIEPRDCEGFMRFTRLGASIYGLSQETFLRREPLAPEGGETLFVMANAPAAGGAWDERRIEAARARVFERLSRGGFPDVLPDAAVSDVWTPGHIEREYLSPGGAIYGTHSHGWRRAFLRPPNRHPRVGGLYHVGGSSHPGGGTPTVLLSARITSGLIGRHEA